MASDRPAIYGASKTKHAPLWRELRGEGVNVVSTWIDEAGEGETADHGDLWLRCITEAATADALIAVHEADDVWKGAYIEIGAALASRVPVYVVGNPPGTFVAHPLIYRCGSVPHALSMIERTEFIPGAKP